MATTLQPCLACYCRKSRLYLFHIVVYSIKNGALINDQDGEVLHDVGEITNALQNVPDFLVPLLSQGIHRVHFHCLEATDPSSYFKSSATETLEVRAGLENASPAPEQRSRAHTAAAKPRF